MTYKKPELLIPASSLEVLKTAVMFGADAVYIGGEAFGLRAKAKNFSSEEMAEGVAFALAVRTSPVAQSVRGRPLARAVSLSLCGFVSLRDCSP